MRVAQVEQQRGEQRVAVLDKVRDQAKITYVDALSPEETARKMGIDVDNLPPEVTLG